jgi:hypothetical protein
MQQQVDYTVSSASMLRRGLKVVGVDAATQNRRIYSSNVRVFKGFFGIHPNHAETIWKDVIANEQLEGSDIDLRAFFMALNFLRVTATEDIRATLFGVDKKKARKQTWNWIGWIANLKQHKIKFPSGGWDTTFVCSVDGSHITMNEPRHAELKKDPKWYSHKHGCAGHNVQIVLSLWDQQCYDFTISRGGTNDKGNVNKSGLLDKIPDGKQIIVDGGYPGDIEKLSGYNQFDSKELKAFKARAKSRHETFNSRMKIFHVLKHKFEHDKGTFPICMTAVAVLVQYMIEDTKPESATPLFDT